jgi:uncharacterized protein YciW
MRAAASRAASGHVRTPRADAPATAPSLHELRWREASLGVAGASVAARRLRRCYRRLAAASDAGGLTAVERDAIAMRVALRCGCAWLARHYCGRLAVLDGGDAAIAAMADGTAAAPPSRLTAILAFVDSVVADPMRPRQAQLRALESKGLAAGALAALGGLVAFFSYQARLLPGLVPTLDADDAAET